MTTVFFSGGKARRALICALPVMLGLWLLASCSAEGPILVGFSGQLTGRHADLGVQGRDGAQLAVDEINQGGGPAGRQLKLIVRDDRGSPDGAREADRELAREGVVAIIGHMTSSQSVAAVPLINKLGVLMISPTTSTSQLSGLDDNFFRVQPVVTTAARDLARVAMKRRGVSRVAIAADADNRAYSQVFDRAFSQALKAAGGQVSVRIYFSSSAKPDFAEMIRRLRGEGSEGLLIIASAMDTALIAQQARLQGWQAPLFSSGWAQTEAMIHNGGKAVEGILIVADYDSNSKSPALQKFRRRFHQRFDREPTFAAAQAFEAVKVLAAALARTEGSPRGLKKALLATKDFPGLVGKISLDRYGDVQRTKFLLTVREGKFRTLAEIKS